MSPQQLISSSLFHHGYYRLRRFLYKKKDSCSYEDGILTYFFSSSKNSMNLFRFFGKSLFMNWARIFSSLFLSILTFVNISFVFYVRLANYSCSGLELYLRLIFLIYNFIIGKVRARNAKTISIFNGLGKFLSKWNHHIKKIQKFSLCLQKLPKGTFCIIIGSTKK